MYQIAKDFRPPSRSADRSIAGDANRIARARGRLDGQALRDTRVIFQIADPKSDDQHFGSRMLRLPDKSLRISIGDGGNPPVSFKGDNIRIQAQNPGIHFGEVLRLNDDGTPHPGNRFAGPAGARPEIWSIVHRTIQVPTRDPMSGLIWANEHGPGAATRST